MASTSPSLSSLGVIQNNLTDDLNSLREWFQENVLIINLKKGKTEVMLSEKAKRLNGFGGRELDLSENGSRINILQLIISTLAYIWPPP